MKKENKNTEKKTATEIQAEMNKIVEEITKMKLERSVNPPKDTNALYKKRKQLARLKTAYSLQQKTV